jgi:hypothetical protein
MAKSAGTFSLAAVTHVRVQASEALPELVITDDGTWGGAPGPVGAAGANSVSMLTPSSPTPGVRSRRYLRQAGRRERCRLETASRHPERRLAESTRLSLTRSHQVRTGDDFMIGAARNGII